MDSIGEVEDEVEDIMTVARERELGKKIKAQGKKTQTAYDRERKQGSAGDSRAFRGAYKKSQALGKQYRREGESHKVYGKGGKVLKRVKSSPRKDPRDVRGGGYQGWSDQP